MWANSRAGTKLVENRKLWAGLVFLFDYPASKKADALPRLVRVKMLNSQNIKKTLKICLKQIMYKIKKRCMLLNCLFIVQNTNGFRHGWLYGQSDRSLQETWNKKATNGRFEIHHFWVFISTGKANFLILQKLEVG